MCDTTAGERSVDELEAAVIGTLDLYFKAQRRQVEVSKGRSGPAFEAYDEARRQLAGINEELEGIRSRTDALKADVGYDGSVGGSEDTELREELSELQKEFSKRQEEIRALAEAEKIAQTRKEETEETLRRVELDAEGDLGLAADEVAGFALHKIEEVDTFKARLDHSFEEGRTSILEAAT